MKTLHFSVSYKALHGLTLAAYPTYVCPLHLPATLASVSVSLSTDALALAAYPVGTILSFAVLSTHCLLIFKPELKRDFLMEKDEVMFSYSNASKELATLAISH